MSETRKTALVTGASTGIGAVYADRLARRGYDLILVARDAARLEERATRLRQQTGVKVDVLPADLADPAQRAKVEERLRNDTTIDLLVNNAGIAAHGTFAHPDLAAWQQLIDVNVTSLTRLTGAVLPAFLARKSGNIINIASVVGLAPELQLGVYGATKAFVTALSQSMQVELGPQGIYVQAVLPAATRTEIWERSGRDVNALQNVMDVEELVDAALVGFDRREPITIPPLPDEAQWQNFNAARLAMLPNFTGQAAPRYRR